MGHDAVDGAPTPHVEVNGIPLEATVEAEEQTKHQSEAAETDSIQAIRQKLQRSGTSYSSIPPPGSILTGKQEHCTKEF